MFDIWHKLRATSSKNAKQEILTANKHNETLKRFFYYCLDPMVTYGIKKIPEYDYAVAGTQTLTIDRFMELLDPLIYRELTGHAAINYLTEMLSRMDEFDSVLAECIIKRDPNCGVDTTVNKVWPGLVFSYPCMLCTPFTKKLADKLKWKQGVYIQKKLDGARINIINDGGVTTLRTRQGKLIECFGQFDSVSAEGYVIDGEILVLDENGKIMSRKEGNGIVNKANKGTISEEEAKRLIVIAWDMVSLEEFRAGVGTVEYRDRLKTLNSHVNALDAERSGLLSVAETDIIFSLEAANEICARYWANGDEGAILKDVDSLWEDSRSKKQIKLKAELECDLLITGYIEGLDKLEGVMGALECKTSDLNLTVNVGGGFSMAQRAQIAANYHNTPIKYVMGGIDSQVELVAYPNGDKVLNGILEVTYNELISNEKGGWSLFLPRATTGDIRLDKDKADALITLK